MEMTVERKEKAVRTKEELAAAGQGIEGVGGRPRGEPKQKAKPASLSISACCCLRLFVSLSCLFVSTVRSH